MRKITLHQALSELKTIEKRIDDKLSNSNLIWVGNESQKVGNLYTKEEYEMQVKASYQSITDLISLQTHLKKALMKANAETDVEMNEKNYKIIDLIVEKDLIAMKKKLLPKMKQQLYQAIQVMNSNNDVVNTNLQRILEATFGRDQSKVSAGDIDAISAPYKKSNEWNLIDPLKIEDKMKQIEQEIIDFETNVDATLSTINAITTIDIE